MLAQNQNLPIVFCNHGYKIWEVYNDYGRSCLAQIRRNLTDRITAFVFHLTIIFQGLQNDLDLMFLANWEILENIKIRWKHS